MNSGMFFARFVVFALAIAFALVCGIAFRTPPFVHPDEKASIGAVRYYETRWLPADIRDPAAAASFSGYGVSRLDQKTVYYFLAGKTARLASRLLAMRVPERFFNVMLFAVFAGFCVRVGFRFSPFFLLAGMTPQTWYLFSYCTSDAWDFLLCAVALYEAACDESAFQRAMRADRLRNALPALFASGTLLGLVALGKATAWAALLLFAVEEGVRLLHAVAAARKMRLARGSLVILVAALWVGAAAVSEGIRYGGRHDEVRREMHEKMRQSAFVPDENGRVAYPSVDLRRRGVPLRTMLFNRKYDFLLTTYASFSGCYGPLDRPSPHGHYLLVGICYALLGAFWMFRFFRSRPDLPNLLHAAALLAVPALLFGASVWHSWTEDMQPQGRYLLPATTAFCALAPLAPAPSSCGVRFVRLVVAALFLLGLLSLGFSALLPLSGR